MTTNTAETMSAPNCSPSSFIESGDGAGAAVCVEVGPTVWVTVTVGTGEGSGELVELPGVSETVGNDEPDVEGEGDGVDSNGPRPVLEDEFEDAHVTPPSTRPPTGT